MGKCNRNCAKASCVLIAMHVAGVVELVGRGGGVDDDAILFTKVLYSSSMMYFTQLHWFCACFQRLFLSLI